jgi:hypothetical protein
MLLLPKASGRAVAVELGEVPDASEGVGELVGETIGVTELLGVVEGVNEAVGVTEGVAVGDAEGSGAGADASPLNSLFAPAATSSVAVQVTVHEAGTE